MHVPCGKRTSIHGEKCKFLVQITLPLLLLGTAFSSLAILQVTSTTLLKVTLYLQYVEQDAKDGNIKSKHVKHYNFVDSV